jgi:hypothetical protein
MAGWKERRGESDWVMNVAVEWYRSGGPTGQRRGLAQTRSQPDGVKVEQVVGTGEKRKAPRVAAAIKGMNRAAGNDAQPSAWAGAKTRRACGARARTEHDKLNLDCLWRCGGLKRRSGLGVDPGDGWYRAAPKSLKRDCCCQPLAHSGRGVVGSERGCSREWPFIFMRQHRANRGSSG